MDHLCQRFASENTDFYSDFFPMMHIILTPNTYESLRSIDGIKYITDQFAL